MWATFLRNSTVSEAHTLLAQGMYVKIGKRGVFLQNILVSFSLSANGRCDL